MRPRQLKELAARRLDLLVLTRGKGPGGKCARMLRQVGEQSDDPRIELLAERIMHRP